MKFTFTASSLGEIPFFLLLEQALELILKSISFIPSETEISWRVKERSDKTSRKEAKLSGLRKHLKPGSRHDSPQKFFLSLSSSLTVSRELLARLSLQVSRRKGRWKRSPFS